MSDFPQYATHQDVSCFSCGGDLGDYPFKSNYAPGRGAWAQECEKCRMATYYDLVLSECDCCGEMKTGCVTVPGNWTHPEANACPECRGEQEGTR